jgi:hypothetical protein
MDAFCSVLKNYLAFDVSAWIVDIKPCVAHPVSVARAVCYEVHFSIVELLQTYIFLTYSFF